MYLNNSVGIFSSAEPIWTFRFDGDFSIFFRFIFEARADDFFEKSFVRLRIIFDTVCEINSIFWLTIVFVMEYGGWNLL